MSLLNRSILIATSAFIILYWSSVLTGLFPLTELVPGYTNWFISFLIPDMYIAISALTAVILMNSKPAVSAVFSIMTGSALIFLGLYALMYGHNTGLLYNLTTDELIEICIKAYCLSAGPFLIFSSCKVLSK